MNVKFTPGVALLSTLTFFPQTVFALSTIKSGLDKVLAIATGTEAQIGATIAVAIVGIMALSGRISWMQAGTVLAGIVIIFGAPQIVSWIR